MKKSFEEYIQETFASYRPGKLTEAMNYAISGGAHFRPELIFAVIKGFGFDEEDGFPAALALEMVHSYSLIQDDMPCMDNDELRRGKPSTHVAYGEDIALLASDALLTQAFGILAESPYDAEARLHMIADLSHLAGLGGMVYGQFLDVTQDSAAMQDREALNTLEDYKTGALFEAALLFGMYIAGDDSNMPFYEGLAVKIGRVFQLQDDLFELTRTPEETGKTNSDERNNKATAFSLYTEEELRQQIASLFEDIDRDLANAPFDSVFLQKLIARMRDR